MNQTDSKQFNRLYEQLETINKLVKKNVHNNYIVEDLITKRYHIVNSLIEITDSSRSLTHCKQRLELAIQENEKLISWIKSIQNDIIKELQLINKEKQLLNKYNQFSTS